MNNITYTTLKLTRHWIIVLTILSFLSACKQPEKETPGQLIPEFAPPVTVMLDTCPPPETTALQDAQYGQSISIIKTSEGSYELRAPDGSLVKDMIPPTIQKMPSPIADFSNFNTEDGLALNTIFCGLRDKHGNLWFGSEGGGLSRYNGKSFTNFTVDEGLIDNSVRGLVEDKNGNIWVGTDAGLSSYDGHKFINYGRNEGFVFGPVRTMIKDKNGKLWIGTLGSGVVSFDPNAPEGNSFRKLVLPTQTSSPRIRAIVQDRNGNFWFGFQEGIIRYRPTEDETSKGRFTSYSSENGLSSNNIWSMLEDSQGNLWFGTRGGVSRFIPEKDKPGEVCFVTYTEEQGLAHNFVRNMFEDNQGNIWFCTLRGGASRLDADWNKRNGELFINYTIDQGLTTNSIYCIIDDVKGNLWLGTRDGGVDRYNGESTSIYDFELGLFPNRVKSIMEGRNGNLWVGVEDSGFSRFDGENFINYSLRPPLSFLSMKEEHDGTLWFGGYGGTFRFIPSRDKSGAGILSVYFISGTGGLAQDTEGNMWIGGTGGLTKYDDDEFTNFSASQGLVHQWVNCIVEDQSKKLWIGTRGGVSRYDGKSFTNFTTAQGLTHNHVTCIVEDHHGNIWFGTQGGGISRYDGKGFINYTTAQGLADNVVSGFKIDEQGVLWIGTNQGLSSLRFSKSIDESTEHIVIGAGALDVSNDELKTYTPVWEIYNNTTGYPVRDMFANAMTLTKVGLPKGDKKDIGVIWGGYGDDKVIRFDPKAVRKSKEPLSPFIESLKIKEAIIPWYSLSSSIADSTVKSQQEILAFGRALLQQERAYIQERFGKIKFDGISKYYPLPQNLVLPHRQNQVSFEFGAIETGRPIQVRYQYMLEGYDTDWNPVTAKTSATYGNMFEGKYTFNIKAMSPDGIWSEPLQYTFRVLPPWWRSWWAYAVYGLCFIGGVFAVDRFQRKRLLAKAHAEAREKELEQAKEIEKAYEDLKSTQSQLIQSEKMASLGELTAGIAHEIQNPLNFVNNFSEVNRELIEELKDAVASNDQEEIQEILKDLAENEDKVKHHGQRAEGIVKGMLQHSRTSQGEKEPTDINALADEYLRLAYHGMRAKDKSFNADFKTDFDPNLPKIDVVPQDIGRVLLNLINNAFYAVNQKAARHSEPDRSLPASRQESGAANNDYKPLVIVSTKLSPSGGGKGEVITITVQDNGPGIPEQVREKIFQPFFTTKPTGQGTGLGLSLSYDIVKAHEGEIKIESDEGLGTTFIISIPITTI